MSHELYKELSSRYRDGDLTPSEVDQFEEHLVDCSMCREVIELDSLIAGNLTESLDALYPVDLEAKVLDLAGEEPWHSKAVSWLRHGEFRLPAPVAIAAALAVIVLGVHAFRTGEAPLPAVEDGDIVTLSPAGAEEWIDAEAAGAEVRSLLRRTRTLLLALTTAVPGEDGKYHLEAEEALSRDLMPEVRMVEATADAEDDTDILTLVRDLELILLDVSTWQGEADADRLALLQNGINERSLIYRVSTYRPRIGSN